MKSVKIMYICSLIALVAAGILFANMHRQAKVVGVIENLKTKTIVFYSSNSARSYLDYKNNGVGAMDMLCIEAMSHMKADGFNSINYKISNGDADPFTQSYQFLRETLKKDSEYVLIDISRGQSRHGQKYNIEGKTYAPITITLSKKSLCYESSLLFAGRLKAYIDEKYKAIPIHIITVDDGKDYNQSLGYIAMLVEFGDSNNSYDEASESLKVFCQSIIQVNSIQR